MLPARHAPSRGVPALGASSCLLLLVALLGAPGAGAEVLDFESQTPGPFGPFVTEGDYLVSAFTGSIEPGGPFCASLPCTGSTGQFVADSGSFIGIGRADSQPFELASLATLAPLGFGTVTVTGTTLSGTVMTSFPVTSTDFESRTLPATFTELVSVSVFAAGLPLGVDDIDVTVQPMGTPGTMVLLSDDRSVLAFGQVCGPTSCDPPDSDSASPSPPFSPFDASVSAGDGGFATQTSTADTGTLAGTGFASGFSDFGFGIGDSTYDVTFRLDGRARIHLTGTLTAEDTLGFGFAESEVFLRRGSQVLFSDLADPFDTLVPFSFDEELPRGTYRLTLQSDGDVSMDGSFDFSLTATPVPVTVPAVPPAGLALLGMLIVGVGYRRRSRAGRV